MLRTQFANLLFRNPVVVASATPTRGYENILKAINAGAGAVVTKSVCFPKKYLDGMEYLEGRRTGLNPRPRFLLLNKERKFDLDMHRQGAFFTLFTAGELYPEPEGMTKIISKVKREHDLPIIASIVGPPGDVDPNYNEWKELARMMEESGADGLELNLHCVPTVRKTEPEIVRAVKKQVKIPVIAKLMVSWENPREVGPAIEKAGADGITAVDTYGFRGIEIDVENQQILIQPTAYSLRGPWWRPVALAYVSELAKSVRIPIMGVSGVTGWKDVVKYLMVGASAVEVCSSIYAMGYRVIREMVSGLEEYMASKGYSQVNELKGVLLKNIVPISSLRFEPPFVMHVNQTLCNGCKMCQERCLFDAIEIKKKIAVIDQARCDGCGLCISVCQQDAISMETQKS